MGVSVAQLPLGPAAVTLYPQQLADTVSVAYRQEQWHCHSRDTFCSSRPFQEKGELLLLSCEQHCHLETRTLPKDGGSHCSLLGYHRKLQLCPRGVGVSDVSTIAYNTCI